MEKILTRRDFMRGTAYVTMGAIIGIRSSPSQNTRVVLIRRKDVWDGNARLKPQVVQEMLDEAVTTLLERKDPVAAFRLFVIPNDIVGIKSNQWRFLPTPDVLETAIERRLLDAGVSRQNIGIDDQGVRRNPIFRNATVLINVRPLRTHYWSGIGGCLKNYIMFTPRPSDYHPDSCADIALFWKLPAVKGKTKLNILSVFNPLFHGRGPHHFDRRYIWNYNGMIVGTDPVAVDAVGLHLINAKRINHFGRERALQTLPKHVTMADVRHGLGTSDLKKIELVKLGWKDEMLI